MLIRRADPSSGRRAVAAIPPEKMVELLQTKWHLDAYQYPGPRLDIHMPEGAADLPESLDAWAQRRGWGLVARPNINKWASLMPLFGTPVPLPPLTTHYYHVTDAVNVPQILRRGLLPRARCTGGRCYPPRVYLAYDFFMALHTRDNALKYAGSVNPITQTEEVCILEIDLSLLRRGTRFYPDPELGIQHENGYWTGSIFTPTHIPPAAIKRVDKGGMLTGPDWSSQEVMDLLEALGKHRRKRRETLDMAYVQAVQDFVDSSTMSFEEISTLLHRDMCASDEEDGAPIKWCVEWHAAGRAPLSALR